jgi:hypothetical protein
MVAFRNFAKAHKNSEWVEQLKYLETTLTNQNSIHKKLRADRSQGMLAIIRCRVFCLPVCYQKYKDQDIQNCNFACCFL